MFDRWRAHQLASSLAARQTLTPKDSKIQPSSRAHLTLRVLPKTPNSKTLPFVMCVFTAETLATNIGAFKNRGTMWIMWVTRDRAGLTTTLGQLRAAGR